MTSGGKQKCCGLLQHHVHPVLLQLEKKLFPWVTADLQGILTEAWFGIYYMGKESPIWGAVLALSMRLSVYSGLTSKILSLEEIEHLRHKSALKREKTTLTVKVNHFSGSPSSLLQAVSQREFTLGQPHGLSGPLPSWWQLLPQGKKLYCR